METASAISLISPSSFLWCSCSLRSVVSNPVIRVPFLSSTFASIRDPFIRSKVPKPRRFLPSSCTSPILDAEPSRKLGLLMEVEGILADVYRQGNCQAFNVAFQKLGLDCANWTEPIYQDLKRKAAGDEEMMLILFFNRIGWPTSLPTNEKEPFKKSIMREKRKALEDFFMSSSFALRPGVENFIDEAIHEGLPIVLLTAYSKNGEVCSTDLVVATLRAGAEYAGLPVQDCVLIAGSQAGVIGAEKIGLPSVVIRSSSTARAEFRKTNAVMDGFGGADLTVSKLLNKRFTDPNERT